MSYKKRSKRKKKQQVSRYLFLLLLLFFAGGICYELSNDVPGGWQTILEEGIGEKSDFAENSNGKWAASGDSQNEESVLEVHFLDVGQGDAALVQYGEHAMLIDAGGNNKGTAVQLYLEKRGIERLDYLIGTHPDADHIGGLDVIITKFDCGRIIMPDAEKDSDTYRDVITAMEYKGYENTLPAVGETYSLGEAEFTIVAPNGTYQDVNDESVGILLTYGENSFLFTGDAGEEAEQDMLQNGISLQADVFKAAHHGSSTSNSRELLETVSPEAVVISCGENNSYGHPHAEVLNNLREMGIRVYRTDEQGSIVAVSDGEEITWNCAPSESWMSGR